MNALNPAAANTKQFQIGLWIVMEDTSSNYYYMEKKVESCDLDSNKIVKNIKNPKDFIGEGKGRTQAHKIVEETLKLVEQTNLALREKNTDEDLEIDYVLQNEIYCVIDLDNNHLEPKTGKTHIEQAYALIETAQKSGKNIYLIVSNECFEVWYILHFQDIAEPLYRKNSHEKNNIRVDKTNSIEFLQYQRLDVNNKKRKDYFERIKTKKGDETKAIQRARNLQESSKTSNPCENPLTDMHILIERLNQFKN